MRASNSRFMSCSHLGFLEAVVKHVDSLVICESVVATMRALGRG